MADPIDRQAVLGYIERLNNSGTGKGKSLEYLRKFVENLPPAEQVSVWGYDGTVQEEGKIYPDESQTTVYDGGARVEGEE